MTSAYPAGLDAFTNPTGVSNLNDVPVLHSAAHANLNDAVEAIEAELGLTPSGASATVKARLDALDTTVAAKALASRTISAGTGLTGGGDLSANRTLTVDLEYLQDQVAAMLTAGTNVTLSYNDTTGALTINASGGSGGAPAADPTSTQWIISPYMQANRDGTGANMPSTAKMFIPVASSYTVDQCAIRVNTGVAASTCTVTVYADSSGRPGSTLATSPAIDCSTSGTKTATFGSPPTVTAPGVWVGVTLSDTATLSIKWASVTGPGAGLNTTVDRLVSSSSMNAPENADTAVFTWVPRVALRRA